MVTYADGYESSIHNLSRLVFYSGTEPWGLATKAGAEVMAFALPIPPKGAMCIPTAVCQAYYWRAELADGTALVQGGHQALRLPEYLCSSDIVHLDCFVLLTVNGVQIYPTPAQVREADRQMDEEFAGIFADSIGVGRKEAGKPLVSLAPNELAKAQGFPEHRPADRKQAENRLLGNMISPSTLPPAAEAIESVVLGLLSLTEYDPTIHERYHLKLYPRSYTNGKPTSDASFRRLEFATTAEGPRWVSDWNAGPSQPTNAEMVGALEAIQRADGSKVVSLDIRGVKVSIQACRDAWARVLAAKAKASDEQRRQADQRMVMGPIDDGDEVGARDAE